MKNYTLLQIIEHCRKMNTEANGCEACSERDPDLHSFCRKEFETFPLAWGERYTIDKDELHEPKVETLRSIYLDVVSIQVSCSVCGEILLNTNYKADLWKSELRDEYLRNFALSELKNYCPHCGARIKEED